MREVFAKLGEDIRLGRRGENLATRVTFDVSGWMSSGEGTIHLLHQRNGDNEPYPCTITVDGGTVKWVITAADVEVAGRGRAELQWLDGDVCKKSAIYTTNTLRALNRAGKVPPEPHEGWVREVLEAKTAAESAASGAQGSAQTAEGWAHDAESSAQMARGAASQAQSAADQAQSAAQTAAMDAANAAAPLAAQQAVAEAENRLVGYQTSAANSAQSALQSEQNAAQSAQAAASSEEEAGRMAQAADVAKNAAETAETNAKNAKSAAETAKNAAETARTAAEAARTGAETAAGEAKTSAENAYDSALTAGACLLNTESYMQKAQSSADRAESAAERAESAGIQSDWNQNDSEAVGYIKNRPFYTESGGAEVFPETTVQIEGESYLESDPTQTVEKLTAGETYTINWNGTVHEVVCREQEVPEWELEGLWKTFEVDGYEQFIAFGYNDSRRTEPGVIIVCIGFGDGDFTVSISAGLGEEVVHKLDNKYLDKDYIKEISRDSDYIQEVINDLYIESVIDPSYIKGVVNEDYIKSVVDEDYIKEVAGGGGGSEPGTAVQPDWNQNDASKPDYIKNRPFYAEGGRTEVMPETTFNLDKNGDCWEDVPTGTELVIGETYIVKVNGVEHEAVCTYDEEDPNEWTTNGWWMLFLSDLDLLIAFSTDEYGHYIWIESESWPNETFRIAIDQNGGEEVVHKLPNKYLDLTGEEWTFELEDGSTVTKRVMVE